MNKHAYQVGVLARTAFSDTYSILSTMATNHQLHVLQEWPDRLQEMKFIMRALIHPTPEVPTFFQPLYIDNGTGMPMVVVDLRIHGKAITTAGQDDSGNPLFSVATATEVGILRVLYDAIFTGMWNQNPDTFTNGFPFAGEIYGTVFASAIAVRSNLEPEATASILAAFHVFYITRSLEGYGARLTEDEKVLLARNLARRYKGEDKRYLMILNTLSPTDLLNLENYCNYIAQQGWSVRLNNLKARDLFGLLGSIWHDARNPKETIAVALEFPPAFTSILLMILQRPSYAKNSSIAKQTKPLLNTANAKQFILGLRTLAKIAF